MTRLRFFAAFGVAATALLGAASPALAQTTVPGFAINRFEPSERGSRFFTVDSVDQAGPFRPAVGVIGDFGWHQMELHGTDGAAKYVVGSQLALHLGASFVFLDRLRASLSAPIYVYQGGNAVTRFDGTYPAASGAAFGDLRVGVDARLVGEPDGAFRLGVGFRFWAPTGNADKYAGDGKVRLSPRLDLAGDIGAFTYAATAGFTYRALHQTWGVSPIGNEIPFGAAVGVKVLDDKLLLGAELQASAAITDTGTIPGRQTISAFGLLTGRYTISEAFAVGLAGGPGLSHASGVANKVLLSFEWAPQEKRVALPPDRDKDTISDNEDACPDVPGVYNDDAKLNGCPVTDRDKDGVADGEDACPDVPGLKTGEPKSNGCPDKDGDKIVDPVDACPDVPGVASEDPKKNGCPPDRDGDKILDADDACPDVPGVQSADPKKNGCPSDRDGDGIADADDACPDHAGPKNADPKKNGCPAVRVHEGQIRILEQVKFKTGSHEILKESDGIIDDVAKTLTEHPEIKKVRIEGHTDNQGKPAMNKGLSQRRANSVLAELVKHKVDRKRMEAKGFGEEKPIDSNETDAGRANNRRVEFHIVDDKKVAVPPPPKGPPAKAPPKAPPPPKAPAKKK